MTKFYSFIRVDESSSVLICVINFKPKSLSHRLHRSTPDLSISRRVHLGCVGRKGGAHCGICPGTLKRDCFDVHRGIVRETPAHEEARRSLGRLGMSVSTGGSAPCIVFLSWISVRIRPSFSSYARLRETTRDYALLRMTTHDYENFPSSVKTGH